MGPKHCSGDEIFFAKLPIVLNEVGYCMKGFSASGVSKLTFSAAYDRLAKSAIALIGNDFSAIIFSILNYCIAASLTGFWGFGVLGVTLG